VAEAYVVDAMRTPVGRRGGGLAGAHPADLGVCEQGAPQLH
jgi:acetyl-CoA C-acetyltransferase